MRKKGILLHISSLPGDYGIGDLGPTAYEFCDYLCENGYSAWQILPLNHPGYGNSPYNPISAFAHNPYLVSPELLHLDGLISASDLMDAKLPRGDSVCYEAVFKTKDKLWQTAVKNYHIDHEVTAYIEDNKYYLKPYMAFLILNHLYEDSSWYHWDKDHRRYSDQLFDSLWAIYREKMLAIAAQQAILEDQFSRFHRYLRSSGISLIGDMPIYLSYNNADVWANQHLFELDPEGNMKWVSGVPPDAFSNEGQLWGNPVYDWKALEESGFAFLFDRFAHALKDVDILRLDHFIGYVNYWRIPADATSAEEGEWVDALPDKFFPALADRISLDRLIAEDLGVLNEKVCYFRDSNHLSGMIVLQFCFDESVPSVDHYPAQCYIYTATHDNKTTREWFEDLEPDSPTISNLREFLQQHPEHSEGKELSSESISSIMLNIAASSPCQMMIAPMQDILGLGADARMNTPGTALGNWQWRIEFYI